MRPNECLGSVVARRHLVQTQYLPTSDLSHKVLDDDVENDRDRPADSTLVSNHFEGFVKQRDELLILTVTWSADLSRSFA